MSDWQQIGSAWVKNVDERTLLMVRRDVAGFWIWSVDSNERWARGSAPSLDAGKRRAELVFQAMTSDA